MSDDSAPNPSAVDELTHPVCAHCGSQEVARDAWANWDPQARDWHVQQIFDQAFCFTCDGETKLKWKRGPADRTTRIRDLNDAVRQNRGSTGTLMCSQGIAAEGTKFVAAAVVAIADFDAFDDGNDPNVEHDFGTVTVDAHKLLFKIDYYDLEMLRHSPDPSNPLLTKRVLTIMLAEEY